MGSILLDELLTNGATLAEAKREDLIVCSCLEEVFDGNKRFNEAETNPSVLSPSRAFDLLFWRCIANLRDLLFEEDDDAIGSGSLSGEGSKPCCAASLGGSGFGLPPRGLTSRRFSM